MGLLLQVSPDRHVTEGHPESRKHEGNPAQAQPQHPKDGRQLAQSLGLVSPIHALWIVAKEPALSLPKEPALSLPKEPALSLPKGATAVAAAVAIHLDMSISIVTHRLVDCAPTLECFPMAIWASLGSSLSFSLDNWQLKNDNGHVRL